MPDRILSSFGERATYIGQGEAFAPLLCLIFEPVAMANVHVLGFIDNLGVVSCLVKGRSRVLDMGCIILAFELRLVSLRSTCWIEHVNSHANCSDGGTRIGVSCPVAAKLGVALTPCGLS